MARKRKSTQEKGKDKGDVPLVDISEQDKWRIIRDSGILQKLPADAEPQEPAEEEQLLSPLTEEIFAALSLIIPHASLLLLFEILAHYQYGRKPTYEALTSRMISGIPIISIFIFYTNRYKHYKGTQMFLFFLGTLCGSRMIWILNHSNWRDVMKFCPPLATAWVYTVIQLHLGHALCSLALVYCFVWYKKLEIVPTI